MFQILEKRNGIKKIERIIVVSNHIRKMCYIPVVGLQGFFWIVVRVVRSKSAKLFTQVRILYYPQWKI